MGHPRAARRASRQARCRGLGQASDDQVGATFASGHSVRSPAGESARIEALDAGVVEGVLRPVDPPCDTLDERDVRPRGLEVEEALRIVVGKPARLPELGEVPPASEAPWPPSFQPLKAATRRDAAASASREIRSSSLSLQSNVRRAKRGRRSKEQRHECRDSADGRGQGYVPARAPREPEWYCVSPMATWTSSSARTPSATEKSRGDAILRAAR